ncbi:MAG: efflux RND transporter periplasmic adaptor subunit [Chitinophagaceae bacterium]|nr:MAG: efflux RND transporter periplasmic adaptor subunit [Chitinophagaceae bacterium]
MKKRIITISVSLMLVATIGVVLANNKAKIDKAAKPQKHNPVIPVKVYEAKEDSFNTSFTINGTTIPAKEVKIASEVQGKLVGLYIHNGDMISTGQVIAILDASVYTVQLSSIEASIAKAKLDLARYTKLIEMGGATPMQAESAQLQINSYVAEKKQVLEQISHMQIRAPFSGKVENVPVELGSFVTYGTVLGQLIDNSSLKINVYLSEQEAFKVKKDQEVIINSVVLTEPKKGKITMISDKADASGKFLAEITFDNKKGEKLKAGILADVLFSTDAVETGLSIPASALLAGTKDAKVYVVNGGKAEIRSIKTGIVTSTKVEVLEGLKTGDQVIISGQLNLENGTSISINK